MPHTDMVRRAAWLKEYREKNRDRFRARDRLAEQKRRDEHPEEERARQRRYRAANIDHYREYNARWHRENRANNPHKVRSMHLKSLYGLTQEQYEQMLAGQGGHCAICSRTPAQEKKGVLHVDHDHVTDRVRGLLCSNHNTALGLCHDKPEDLRALAAYLERSS